jgi:hypothetical protein
MLKVKCCVSDIPDQDPIAFTLMDRQYKVNDVIDRWYGEGVIFFKVKADDDNIYLLKYNKLQDHWDLILYQNPRRLDSLPFVELGKHSFPQMNDNKMDQAQSFH